MYSGRSAFWGLYGLILEHFFKVIPWSYIKPGKSESCDFLLYKDCVVLALISKRIELQKRAWSHLEDLFSSFRISYSFHNFIDSNPNYDDQKRNCPFEKQQKL